MDLFSWAVSHEGSSVYFLFFLLISCGLGLPIPEDIPLIALGYIWHLEDTSAFKAFLAGFAGVLIGDVALYFIGQKFGPELFKHKILLKIFDPSRINRTKARFRKYGLWVVFFGRFVAGVRAVVFFTSGATRIPFRKYILVDFLATLISVPVWIGLGSYFGDEIDDLLHIVKSSKEVAFWAVIGLISLYVLIKIIISQVRSSNN